MAPSDVPSDSRKVSDLRATVGNAGWRAPTTVWHKIARRARPSSISTRWLMSPGFDSGVGSGPPIEDMRRSSGRIDRLFNPQARHLAPTLGGRVARLRPGALQMSDESFVVAIIDDDEILRE